MNRVKEGIMRTMADVKRRYDAHPNIYIAGFYNGMALCHHHLQGYAGKPDAIEVPAFRVDPPKPLEPQPPARDEQEYEFLIDKVLTASRAVLTSILDDSLHSAPTGTQDLFSALHDLDSFIDGKMEEAGQGESTGAQDAGAQGQEGSSPSPASTDQEQSDVAT